MSDLGYPFRVLHRLSTADALEEYAECYAQASGYRVPLDYLRRSLVFGFIRRGKLAGGVVIGGAEPFRTLDRVPEGDRDAVAAAIDARDTIELTCVWLAPAERSGPASVLFWFGLFLETGRRGARHVLFGTECPRLKDMYLIGKPRMLYSGPVTVDGQHRHGWIFHGPVADRWSALRRISLYKLHGDRVSVTQRGSGRGKRAKVENGQAGHALAVPLRGLRAAGGEVARGAASRLDRTGPDNAAAALAAATDGGWAVVTGASSGIGLAYANQLAARGAGLLLVADTEDVYAVAERLSSEFGVRAEALVADLARREDLDKVVSWINGRRVEVLVNNAGVGHKGRFVDSDPDDYATLLSVNALAPLLLTRALLPAMVARRRGAVIHVASVNALAPMPRSAVYSATKTFLLSYATAIWYENRDRGVVFQTLLPGTTATPFHDRQGTVAPAWAMVPTEVAESSLAALGRRPVHVTGVLNKSFRTLAGLMPLTARTAAAAAALTASFGDGAAADDPPG